MNQPTPLPPDDEGQADGFDCYADVDIVADEVDASMLGPPTPAPPSVIRALEKERARVRRWKDWRPGQPIPPEEEPGPAKLD